MARFARFDTEPAHVSLATILGAAAIGLSLGLFGSGGSILTVPVLIHLAGQGEKVAIAGSLFVVGAVAAAGALVYARRGLVDVYSVLWFGLPGVAGTWAGAALSRHVSADTQITLFTLVLLGAAVLMFRSPPAKPDAPRRRHRAAIVAEGLAVGVLTGLVGVGGGFLILPALVLLGGLDMTLAVGTSLVIIALKSFAGFAKYVEVLAEQGLELDWGVLGVFAAIGVVGSVIGERVGARLPQQVLRRAFAGGLVLLGGALLVGQVV